MKAIKFEIQSTYKGKKVLKNILDLLEKNEIEVAKLLCTEDFDNNLLLARALLKILIHKYQRHSDFKIPYSRGCDSRYKISSSYYKTIIIIGADYGLGDREWARELLVKYEVSKHVGINMVNAISQTLDDQIFLTKIYKIWLVKAETTNTFTEYLEIAKSMSQTLNDKELIKETILSSLNLARKSREYTDIAICIGHEKYFSDTEWAKDIFSKSLKLAKSEPDFINLAQAVYDIYNDPASFRKIYHLAVLKVKTYRSYMELANDIEYIIEAKGDRPDFTVEILEMKNLLREVYELAFGVCFVFKSEQKVMDSLLSISISVGKGTILNDREWARSLDTENEQNQIMTAEISQFIRKPRVLKKMKTTINDIINNQIVINENFSNLKYIIKEIRLGRCLSCILKYAKAFTREIYMKHSVLVNKLVPLALTNFKTSYEYSKISDIVGNENYLNDKVLLKKVLLAAESLAVTKIDLYALVDSVSTNTNYNDWVIKIYNTLLLMAKKSEDYSYLGLHISRHLRDMAWVKEILLTSLSEARCSEDYFNALFVIGDDDCLDDKEWARDVLVKIEMESKTILEFKTLSFWIFWILKDEIWLIKLHHIMFSQANTSEELYLVANSLEEILKDKEWVKKVYHKVLDRCTINNKEPYHMVKDLDFVHDSVGEGTFLNDKAWAKKLWTEEEGKRILGVENYERCYFY